ncbi:MAG: hypothetical protein V1820_01945 [archaeon]
MEMKTSLELLKSPLPGIDATRTQIYQTADEKRGSVELPKYLSEAQADILVETARKHYDLRGSLSSGAALDQALANSVTFEKYTGYLVDAMGGTVPESLQKPKYMNPIEASFRGFVDMAELGQGGTIPSGTLLTKSKELARGILGKLRKYTEDVKQSHDVAALGTEPVISPEDVGYPDVDALLKRKK